MQTVTNKCGTTTFTWNARNQLAGINGFKADCSTLTAAFKYDALGRRYEKNVNGATLQYVYDGLDVIQEKQGSTVSANYMRTLNIDEPLMRVKGTTIRHYKLDALNSVIALADDSGVLKTTYVYDPFGAVTISGAEPATDSPYQFTGKPNVGGGVLYFNERYLYPELRRFMSEDPIGLKGGTNYYSYVGGNPVNYRDPLGTIGPVLPIIGIGWCIAYLSHAGDNISNSNGNIWAGYNRQDQKCSIDPVLGPIADTFLLKKCQAHDSCYDDNQCNYSSWISSLLGGTKSCNQCNSNFFN
jgi:RHS repeat-associated protein